MCGTRETTGSIPPRPTPGPAQPRPVAVHLAGPVPPQENQYRRYTRAERRQYGAPFAARYRLQKAGGGDSNVFAGQPEAVAVSQSVKDRISYHLTQLRRYELRRRPSWREPSPCVKGANV